MTMVIDVHTQQRSVNTDIDVHLGLAENWQYFEKLFSNEKFYKETNAEKQDQIRKNMLRLFKMITSHFIAQPV